MPVRNRLCRQRRGAPRTAAPAGDHRDAPAARRAAAAARSRVAAASNAAWPRMTPISSAFCCPVLASAAGRPVAASCKRHVGAMRADRGRARRRVASRGGRAVCCAQPLLGGERGAAARAGRRSGTAAPCGRPGRRRRRHSSAALSAATMATRAAVAATPWRAICVLHAGQPGRIGVALRQQPVAAGHGRVVRRPPRGRAPAPAPRPAGRGSGGGRRRLPGTAGPSAASARRRLTRAAISRLVARRRAVEAEHPPVRPARPAACRCRYPRSPPGVAKRPATAPAPVAPSRTARQARRCGRRAGRVRAPAAKWLPADWSCRCRWRRCSTAMRAAGRQVSAA